jgi:hypothetical protein
MSCSINLFYYYKLHSKLLNKYFKISSSYSIDNDTDTQFKKRDQNKKHLNETEIDTLFNLTTMYKEREQLIAEE